MTQMKWVGPSGYVRGLGNRVQGTIYPFTAEEIRELEPKGLVEPVKQLKKTSQMEDE